jgi:hypothetical protein
VLPLKAPERRPLKIRLAGGLVLWLATLYCAPRPRKKNEDDQSSSVKPCRTTAHVIRAACREDNNTRSQRGTSLATTVSVQSASRFPDCSSCRQTDTRFEAIDNFSGRVDALFDEPNTAWDCRTRARKSHRGDCLGTHHLVEFRRSPELHRCASPVHVAPPVGMVAEENAFSAAYQFRPPFRAK